MSNIQKNMLVIVIATIVMTIIGHYTFPILTFPLLTVFGIIWFFVSPYKFNKDV